MIIQTEVTIRLQHVSQGWFLWGEDDSGTLLSVATWKKMHSHGTLLLSTERF